MLTVLANVGSLMAEGLEYSWTSNRERINRLARSLREGAISLFISNRSVILSESEVIKAIKPQFDTLIRNTTFLH